MDTWVRFVTTPAKNTQTARIVKVLQLLTDIRDAPLTKLENHTKRKDGRSYISKDASWMKERYEIRKGWYFEGCMSLADKTKILHALPQLGLSSRQFAKCAQDFVAGKSVEKYRHSGEEAIRQIELWKEQADKQEKADQ